MNINIDSSLINLMTEENLVNEYKLYKKVKTDDYFTEPKIRIQMGVDGVSWKAFESQLNKQCEDIANSFLRRRFFFKPFREIKIPKKYGVNISSDMDRSEYRLISIGCIRDVLVQKILYQTLLPTLEEKFSRLPNVSFAYRPGKSAPSAAKMVRRYINEGFQYVLDADIKSFFDEIPHNQLLNSFTEYISSENQLTLTYLKRFVSVDRVLWEDYMGNEKLFFNKKPKITTRTKGIPQGGVLSGLIANLYLHDFDCWVISSLKPKYDIQYIRYADDFLILAKEFAPLERIKEEIKQKLFKKGLQLHNDKEKTKSIDLTVKRECVEFVGFAISPTGIRIKRDNVSKFKLKLKKIINQSEDWTINGGEIAPLINRITYKILGNEALQLRKCRKCQLYESKRSWLNYFSIITDVQQLRAIDTWIRKEIYMRYYKQTNKRLSRSELESFELVRLESLYYKAKNIKSAGKHCRCSPLEATFTREEFIKKLFHGTY